jgi:drug/metabolite transporter (DMT)-like permease
MSPTAFVIVLCAAFLPAFWNALNKASGDRAVSLGMVAMSQTNFGAVVVNQVPVPPREALPFIAASTVIHWGYYYLIFHAYRLGDLSLVYPIARGIAPMLVTVGALLTIGERLPPLGWAGVVAISAGVLMLSWRSVRAGLGSPSILLALATGVNIASYSVVDGIGVRTAGHTLSYVAWLYLLEGVVAIYLVASRPLDFAGLRLRTWALGLFGGLCSALAYGLAIYATTLAPIGLVSALRETSVIFAAAIGIIWLHERPWRPRLAAAAVVAAGIVLIAIA